MSLSRRDFLEAAAGLSLTASALATESSTPEAAQDGVVELRQYTLRGGQREALISVFEQNFIESQNGLGAHVLGTFRDLDDPDRFVWLRGFRDMAARPTALGSFYGGPVWHAHGRAANATMIDSDNVLLLRPAGPGLGFAAQPSETAASGGIIGATLYYLHDVDAAQFTRVFDQTILPHLVSAGARPFARLVAEESPNNFPRLPIRERDRTFVWFARWPDVAAEDAFVTAFRKVSGWRDSIPDAVLPALMQKPERLRLAPTARSVLR
ncbi:MAG TPA: NIPSNAP family protein [Steroidobacteraceae bacterium]|nr:NIPSNAP family protein [Steroidobacteraceae bacterium]